MKKISINMTLEEAYQKYLLIVSPFYFDTTIDVKDFEAICQQAYAILFDYAERTF